jgi:RNA polymerase sigma-70 factor (ECF subfamily)
LFFQLAYGVVRNAASAEDACQAALLKAWEHRREVANPEQLRAWISRVVLNESLAVARRARLERRTLERQHRSRPGNRPDDAAARSGTPSALRAVDLRESLLIAMDQLPELTRLVVALRVMHGSRGNDVSDLLGCSASEVSRHLTAGMARLRELVRGWDESDL